MEESLRGLARAREEVNGRGGRAEEETLTQILQAAERARRAADALELSTIGQVSRWDEERGPDGLYRPVHRPLGEVAEMAADAVAVAVGTGPGEAHSRCELAARAVTDLAELADLVGQGLLRERSLRVVARETQSASETGVTAVVEHLLAPMRGKPDSIRIVELDNREIARACRRILQRLEPEALADECRRNRREKLDLRLDPGPVGTSDLTATLPTEVAMAVKAAADAVGSRRREEDPEMPIGAARAWGLADLALRGTEVRAEVRLGIPVVTSAASRLGLAPACGGESGHFEATSQSSLHLSDRGGSHPDQRDAFGIPVEDRWGPGAQESRIVTGSGPDMVDVLPEEWGGAAITSQVPTTFGPGGQPGWVSGCEIPGVGLMPADAVAAITSNLDTKVTRALLDARIGTLVETSNPRYVIPGSLREFVTARDGICRMWGCNRRVRPEKLEHPNDIDHARPWPAGESSPGNLSALCRHHHRVKHSPRWRHVLHADGTTEWISPGGVPAMTFPDHTVHPDADEGQATGPGSPPAVGASELLEAFAEPPPF